MRMYPPVALSIALLVTLEPSLRAQPASVAAPAPEPKANREYSSRDELLRQIKVCEDAFRHAQTEHAADGALGEIDVVLGGVYEDAGMYTQAELTFQQALKLLRDSPPVDRANALREFAILDTLIGKTRDAEKKERDSIALFEAAGDPKEAAYARVTLANTEVKERNFAQAAADAKLAAEAIGDGVETHPVDVVAAQQTLGFALAKTGRCGEAVSVLKHAIDLAKRAFGEDSLPVGVDYYLLGHSAWECDDPGDAAAWMQRGIERMKRDLGWGQAVYLEDVGEYARFLRQRGQVEQAAAEEREVRMANSVVDAREMATSVSGLR